VVAGLRVDAADGSDHPRARVEIAARETGLQHAPAQLRNRPSDRDAGRLRQPAHPGKPAREQVGCLSAPAGGTGVANAALAAARTGRNPALSEILAGQSGDGAGLSFGDVLHAAEHGDSTAVEAYAGGAALARQAQELR
jgi:hypothetical protein